MEVTEHQSDEHDPWALFFQTEMERQNKGAKMQLLTYGNFKSKDHLFQTLQDVYHNFTLIRKAVVDRLDDLDKKNSQNYLIGKRWEAGFLITFCRCQLNRIIEEDGITINPSLAGLLSSIECRLLELVNDDNPIMDRHYWPPLFGVDEMLQSIKEAYSEASPIYSYQLIIRPDQMMEFLNQCLEDLDTFKQDGYTETFLKENITLLRYYLELLTKEQTPGGNLEKLLIAVENAAYYMSRYFFFDGMCISHIHYFHHPEKFHEYQYQFRFEVLKVLVLQPGGFSNSKLPMSDELVIGHVKCVQGNLLELLKNKATGVTNALKGQLIILHEGLSFLMHLLITYLSKQEKLSNIWLDFQALVTNVGSVICSCCDNPKTEEMSLQLFDLLDKNNVIKGEIIKIICCIVLERMGRESPKQDQLSSLGLLLQNLKEFMDLKPDWTVNWKDHQNMVLFISYLIQNNIRGCIMDDKLSLNIIQLDVNLISHDEFVEVLISNQVVAFNMACHSLLRRHKRFRWWELYFGTKEHSDMQMCIGTLKAIVLSSTTPLTNELLFAYAECVQDSLIKLLRDKVFDELKDQFKILQEGLSTLVRLLLSYKDEQEKVSRIKVGVQDLVWSVASVICLHFSNSVNCDSATKRSSNEISNLVEKMNLIIVETEELLYLVNIEKIRRESPKTDQLSSLNLLLQNWKGLMECESDLINTWKDQFQMIHENLVSFKSFITSGSLGDDESQQLLCSSIMDVGYVAEYLLTTFSIGACPIRCREGWIYDLIKHVELIKAAVMVVNEKRSIVKEIHTDRKDQGQILAQTSPIATSTDVVVGLEVEMRLIRKRLAGHLKQVDVISIIGMPGIGKTTLARKAFEDKYTVNHFDILAWCCISQEYNKKDLFLTILGCIIELKAEIRIQSVANLSIMVHKELMGRRYFIVLDDIWDINIFMYLKRFFPEDNRGSRILLTSRSKVIGSQAQVYCHNELVEPCILTDEQSWDLLERKVYNRKKCPPELRQIGKGIAVKCKGLPLALVVVGGVLAKGAQNQEFWEQVTENLTSYLARDSESQFMAALQLSYEFLPECLKPMFLYIGAFPEDKEISADKLMQLCIAEGFVQRTESTSSEIQAETNLLDLVDRSLVMVAKRKWDGSVKTCHIHDLLRDMCLVKAKEEKFMQQVRVHDELPDPVMYQRRLSIYFERDDETSSRHLFAYKDLPKFSITPPTYSLLFFHAEQDKYEWERSDLNPNPVISSLKLLKVFDANIFKITQNIFDKDLIMLVHLRYLSLYVDDDFKSIPSSISRLRSLETLIIKFKADYKRTVKVPETIWEMTKLRHLDIFPCLKFNAAPENHFILENLETLSVPLIDVGEEESIFKKVHCLKILECLLGYDDDLFLNFGTLSKLESLTMSTEYNSKIKFTGQLKVSSTLKTLNIKGVRLKWSQISIFQTLPNLEVLKLGDSAVEDEVWDMGDDDVFNNLKFLKLSSLNIERWSAISENFPKLEKLVLLWCRKLKEIPSDLGAFDTLKEIRLIQSPDTLVKLVKEIQKEQEEFGNDSLKFYFLQNLADL